MSIVEDSVAWLETPLILIKSALMPGTVDELIKKYNKKIAVSVELIGEGKYFVPFWKHPHPEDPRMHDCLIVGGEKDTAVKCAEFIWEKVSPDIKITLMSAREAEICKLMENTWGALKVTFANEMFEICERYGGNYMQVLQGFGSDGRVEKMHMRVVSGKRGWKSKCWDKDPRALYAAGKKVGYKIHLIKTMLEANKRHLRLNDKD
jgi:UDPglucose 6-dehydrogenase